MPTKLVIFLFFTLLACSSENDKEVDSNSHKDQNPELTFQLIYKDSLGYGSRGMEVFQEEVYFSGINGMFFKLDKNLQTKTLYDFSNDSLDFRDLLVLGENHFIAINSGEDKAFIVSFQEGKIDTLFTANHKGAFFDDLAQDEKGNIYCLGDPEGEAHKLYLIRSKDLGRTWNRIYDFVELGQEEFFFAASGSCMAVQNETIFLAVGGKKSYVLCLQNDHPATSILQSKIPSGKSSGMNAILVENESIYAVGGDYAFPEDSSITFQKFGENEILSQTGGYQSSITKEGKLLVCTGRNGTYYSLDEGQSWSLFLDESFYKVILANQRLYCSGPQGKVHIYKVDYGGHTRNSK